MNDSAASLRAEYQRPEGKLIEDAAHMRRLSARKAAQKAGISDGRWRQIVNGYTLPTAGQVVPVTGPDDTLARMAQVVGVSPDQLRSVGRDRAADLLAALEGMEAESEWQTVGTAMERLERISAELQEIVRELQTNTGK